MAEGKESLCEWRDRYTQAGVATIPLPAGRKGPPVTGHGWQMTLPGDQWQQVGDDFRGNLGVLAHPKHAILDSDSLQTEMAIGTWARDLGLRLPTVKTQSGQQHGYVNLAGAPEGYNWGKLSCGPGELRVRNAYVVAPPSVVNGRPYYWKRGSPEALAHLPPVAWRDVRPLLQLSSVATTALLEQPGVATIDLLERPSWTTTDLDTPPVRLVYRAMPKRVSYLLSALCNCPRGGPVATYDSRSEAEAAVVTTLILSGWGMESIAATFEGWQPGHYADAGKHQGSYLTRTYRAALSHLASTPPRPEIAQAYRDAEAMPWPGRSGLLDQAVYLGLLSLAWQAATWEPYASVRDLAELAASWPKNTSTALKRLQKAGLAQEVQTYLTVQATVWRIMAEALQRTRAERGGHSSKDPHARYSQTPRDVAEVWGYSGLGRSAGAIYTHLDSRPMTNPDLIEATGKAKRTVQRACHRLEAHGLAEHSPDGWVRGPASVAEFAETMRAQDLADRRRSRHDLSRQALRYWQGQGKRPKRGVIMPHKSHAIERPFQL